MESSSRTEIPESDFRQTNILHIIFAPHALRKYTMVNNEKQKPNLLDKQTTMFVVLVSLMLNLTPPNHQNTNLSTIHLGSKLQLQLSERRTYSMPLSY